MFAQKISAFLTLKLFLLCVYKLTANGSEPIFNCTVSWEMSTGGISDFSPQYCGFLLPRIVSLNNQDCETKLLQTKASNETDGLHLDYTAQSFCKGTNKVALLGKAQRFRVGKLSKHELAALPLVAHLLACIDRSQSQTPVTHTLSPKGNTDSGPIKPSPRYDSEFIRQFISLKLSEKRYIKIVCSAAFPLDFDVDSDKGFLRFTSHNEKFSVTVHESTSTETSTNSTFTGLYKNYTFYSVSDSGVYVTVELSFQDCESDIEPLSPGLRIGDLRPSGIFRKAAHEAECTYIAATSGKNPTESRNLRTCLQNQSCGRRIYVWNQSMGQPTELASSITNGIAYCGGGAKESVTEYFTPISCCEAVNNISLIWDDKNVMLLRKIREGDQNEVFVVPQEVNCFATPYHTLELVANDYVTMECLLLGYALREPVFWLARYDNGDEILIHRDGKVFNFTGNDTTHVTNAGLPLQLQCAVDTDDPILITETKYSWEFVPLNPPKWHGNSTWDHLTSEETVFQNGSKLSTLTLPPFEPRMEGEYICSARNSVGGGTRRFKVLLYKEKNIWMYVGVAIGIMSVVSTVGIWCSRKYFLEQGRLTATEIMLFEKGDANRFRSDQYAHENANFLPYNRDYEINWSDFKVFDEEKLGQGEFGIVFKGYLARNPSQTIAVKTVKGDADRNTVLALLSELKLMIHLETHANVIKLMGACTEFLRGVPPRLYIMVEYCPLGSVNSYLRGLDKEQFETMHLNPGGASAIEESNLNYESVVYLTIKDLIGWAIQIARGMQHLESKKVVHGDLATRNVLLYSKAQVKITDFGLSRQLLNYEDYVKESQTKLPWRWLALETLKFHTFSHKSDVWAYGVTLWEIFTLGLVPYPTMKWTTEFVLHLEDNLRLYQPKFSTDNIYKLMMRCWDAKPDNRPDFKEIEDALCSLPE